MERRASPHGPHCFDTIGDGMLCWTNACLRDHMPAVDALPTEAMPADFTRLRDGSMWLYVPVVDRATRRPTGYTWWMMQPPGTLPAMVT